MKKYIRVNGQVPDGRLVLGGIFEFCETTGFPLADTIRWIHEHNMLMDVKEFCISAARNGWNYNTIKARVEDAYRDSK